MDEISTAYLTLALNIERHFEGFVDAYFGPTKLKAEVEAGEPRPLDRLEDDARQLQVAIEASDYDGQRKDFLARQTNAMAAVIGTLSGDRLDFVQEVELCFDITPTMVEDTVFEAAHAEMDRLLPGSGSLIGRLTAWKKRLELEPDRILPVFDRARQEIRRRTWALVELPPGEDVMVQLVKDQPWGAYNWYLGNYQSRIDLNTDLPVRANSAIPMLAHEAYPGHHTEHAIKEYTLYNQAGRGEHAIQLLLAPESVVSEGLADHAWRMIFDESELAGFLRDELYPLAGLGDVDIEQQIRLQKAREALSGVGGNAALLLHHDGRPPDEVRAYLERYGLSTPQEAAQGLKFLSNALFRAYIFNYAMGEAMLEPLLEGPDRAANFHRLLSEPLTPTQIRHWVAEQGYG